MTLPSDRIRGARSGLLSGRTIVLAVSGSIAAVETVKLARDLVRHGADVVPVMTSAACGILNPEALRFATGHAPIVSLTGAVEHVDLCGEGGTADLLLVAPATANTIGKMALGIDDTPVATFATTAIGAGKTVLVAPAMHAAMHGNPAVGKNLETLLRMGVEVLPPLFDEEKAKLASTEHLVDAVIRAARGKPLAGLAALVAAGGSQEPMDDVRVVTNRSSGAFGVALARSLWLEGADVTLLAGSVDVGLPPHIPTQRFDDVEGLVHLMEASARSDARPTLIAMTAALSDFAPDRHEGKIGSDQARSVKLHPLPKVIDRVPPLFPDALLLSFKLEPTLEAAVKEARGRVADSKRHWVFANGAETLGAAAVNGVLLGPGNVEIPLRGPKEEVAMRLVEELLPHLGDPS